VNVAEGIVIGVDIDAVCADHNAAFREHVADALGVSPGTLGEQLDWNYRSWGLSDEDFLRIHQQGVRESMFLDMPPIPGVKDALKSLAKQGATIRVITHRLYAPHNHQKAISDTAAWLDKHRIPYHDLCMVGDKPAVYADVYIDDAPHNVRALRDKTEKPVIVFDQPYNQDLDGPRVSGWDEVPQMVLDVTGVTGRLMQGTLFNADEVAEDPLAHLSPRDRTTAGKSGTTKLASRLCGAPTLDHGKPCRRPVLSGKACPDHTR
jgi:5'(3')-deoxyribonucleotidase